MPIRRFTLCSWTEMSRLASQAARHSWKIGATAAIGPPAMLNWLYLFCQPREDMYFQTSVVKRGSMHFISIAS